MLDSLVKIAKQNKIKNKLMILNLKNANQTQLNKNRSKKKIHLQSYSVLFIMDVLSQKMKIQHLCIQEYQ